MLLPFFLHSARHWFALPVKLLPIRFALRHAWNSIISPNVKTSPPPSLVPHLAACVCVHTQRWRTDRRDSDCSLSDGAETLEAYIIDAVVNRGLQWPTGTAEWRMSESFSQERRRRMEERHSYWKKRTEGKFIFPLLPFPSPSRVRKRLKLILLCRSDIPQPGKLS